MKLKALIRRSVQALKHHRSRFLARAFLQLAVGAIAAYAQPFVYISNVTGYTVSVVNAASGTVVASISVPGASGLAVTPDGASIYAAAQTVNSVSVISTSGYAVTANIPVGQTPVQLAINPSGSQVYVVDQGSNQISVIETGSKSRIAVIPVGLRPCAVAFNPDGSRAFVPNMWAGTVSIIDTASRSVTREIAGLSGPAAVAVSADGRRLYVANGYDNTLTVHDAATGAKQATIPGLVYPTWLAITPNGGKIFVTNGNGSSVSIIDPSSNAISATLPVGNFPSSVAISTDGTRAYVVNEYSFSMSVVDVASNSVVNTVPGVGIYPYAIATLPAVISPPPPPACTYSLSAAGNSFTAAGGTGAVNVTSNCAWTASSNASFLSISSGQSGSGNGTVTYAAGPNNSTGALSGTLTIAGQTFTVTEAGFVCTYSLSSAAAAVSANGGTGSLAVTAPQPCAWSAASDTSWLTITAGTSGQGSGALAFSAAANTSSTSRTGNLTVGGQNFKVTQAGVTVQLPQTPFGVVDTPAENSRVMGAISVTGWALSTSGIAKIEFWREANPGEATPGSLLFVSKASIVSGARPDIAPSCTGCPGNTSGWGAQILTNELPSNDGTPGTGNGTYKIHVIATGATGLTTDLGSRTIIADNAHATLPFGTIDTPGNGEVVSGLVTNFGWVVTPNPANVIPKDASSIWVFIDNQPVGHPLYNQYRPDVATLFPGLQNSSGAIGVYMLDTTRLGNGLHSLAWSARDSAGNLQGIGSRNFIVQN